MQTQRYILINCNEILGIRVINDSNYSMNILFTLNCSFATSASVQKLHLCIIFCSCKILRKFLFAALPLMIRYLGTRAVRYSVMPPGAPGGTAISSSSKDVPCSSRAGPHSWPSRACELRCCLSDNSIMHVQTAIWLINIHLR